MAAQRRTEGRTKDRFDSLASIDASKGAPTGALAHHKRGPGLLPVGPSRARSGVRAP
ncbi:hypothetical protein SHKM778_39860 [Streptomyces sp. KM77-8]|uniref:Uncharacterized protein n=1 Tax=Streptomyces haneummycinicus TaxID=3074435 RepID=A0AAT9HJQ1_9ACTN